MPAPASASARDEAADNGRAATSRGILLSIALRTLDSSGMAAGVSWTGDSPASALALDILAASEGAADQPQGWVLGARFFNLQSALLAVRRVQFALDGLAETLRSSVTATIAIVPADDPAAASVAATVESLAPGQILLSARMAEAVRHLPGLTVRPAVGDAWRELLWRSEDPKNLTADEQSVLGLIRALGREDPLASYAESPAPAPAPAVTATTGVFHAPPGLGRSLDEPETARPFWKKPWVMVGAGAAVLVLLAALIIPGMVSGNHTRTPAPDAAARPAPPAAAPIAPSSASGPAAGSDPAAQEKPRDQKPPTKPPRLPRSEPKTEASPEARTDTKVEPPVPKPSPASCYLTAGEIAPSLQRAERLMYAGKLPEAQAAYQRLAGCPAAHDRAVEGLRLVKQRIAAQSPSAP
jgi:hypothetical protein